MIVFDFDKTLTNKDTLFGFYRQVDGDSSFFSIKRVLLLFTGVASKLKLLNNDQLKAVGVRLFLKGKSKATIQKAAETYARKIQLNGIYTEDYLVVPRDSRLIISASFEEYLNILLADEKILASQLQYKSGLVSGVKVNLYGAEKKVALHNIGLDEIDMLYTDSYSDEPLMVIAKKVYLITNGRKEVIKNVD